MSNKITSKSLTIAKYRESNPCLTLQELGDKFGLTKERIRQILNSTQHPTKSIRQSKTQSIPVACHECGKLMNKYQNTVLYRINICNQQYFFCDFHCKGKWYSKHPDPNHRKYKHAQILEAYKIKSYREVAKEFGCSENLIFYIAHLNNFKKNVSKQPVDGSIVVVDDEEVD